MAVGLEVQVLRSMMEAEATEIAGPKGKHLCDRQAFRHGAERGSAVRRAKVAIQQPRVRVKNSLIKALRPLQKLADDLENRYPRAAASLREGLEETLSVTSRTGWPANEDAEVNQRH
ncbi:hypothetical protein kuro4_27660 [Gelria sp. Kuro-4]|nr:hypothetical protein kuro4_27660 [Gelria sp. Kuro-4]